MRRAGHGFLAPGHNHGGVPAADHPGGIYDSREAGEANLVDGDGRDVPANTCRDGALPCRILASARLQHLSHDDSVHLFGFYAAGRQCGADGVGAEVDGGESGKLPIQPTLWGTGSGKDDNVIVVSGVAHGLSSGPGMV